jgi:light-regulated signal transduction histidine kinase (bacteriophytochrome)
MLATIVRSAFNPSLLATIGKTSRKLSFDLPICKKVVDNHLGTISIELVGGGGATVCIVLPIFPGIKDHYCLQK